ncbi:unnamed protein product [Closterium sp. NIES-64]|nr:unnamed protein product [Closterium sp. NIES-64]
MGANAAAASDVVPAEVRVGTVVLAGSLAQPEPVYFDQNRCVTAPEIAGGKADVLVWWDVFSERTMCNAVQLTFKMGASVKSIRCVLDNICRKAKCPKNSTCIKTKDSQEPFLSFLPTSAPFPPPPSPFRPLPLVLLPPLLLLSPLHGVILWMELYTDG